MASTSPGTLFARALTLRCPNCGSRGLVHRWFGMAERCPRCGLHTDRVAGHWIGAVGINTIVTFAALAAVLFGSLIAYYPEYPVGRILVVAVPVAVLLPVFLWPFSRTLWTAVDIVMRPVRPEELGTGRVTEHARHR